jgi:hypothetical protein
MTALRSSADADHSLAVGSRKNVRLRQRAGSRAGLEHMFDSTSLPARFPVRTDVRGRLRVRHRLLLAGVGVIGFQPSRRSAGPWGLGGWCRCGCPRVSAERRARSALRETGFRYAIGAGFGTVAVAIATGPTLLEGPWEIAPPSLPGVKPDVCTS